MRTFAFIAALCCALSATAQSGSEIYLFELSLEKDRITLVRSENITNRPGYDNQPFFHPDKTLLYYTAADSTGSTDIVEFNYASMSRRKITQTPDREYSPTVTPDKKFLSCIIQRADGKQDLGKYPIDGGTPVVLIDRLTVGYHAWESPKSIVLFVLGEPMTLRRFSLKDGKDAVLAENIGRSLHAIPKTGGVSFVQKTTGDDWAIKKLTDKSTTEELAKTLPGHEDLAWTPDGRIIMSDGEKLFFTTPGKNSVWKPVEVNSTLPLKGITRLAVNAKGDRLAVVVAE
ncbi:TolB family protein [Chryseolinea lacunae]|uniref:PD40 domain-containing protein n=1 Tax=Chryseolinea lacunae TaxID=2801331 RepID=A0ABS1KQD0_9BACT|nr:PD40 domain-containing protein [Chryseolinea lacunae]MBL0741675.1 PD40 domain-containing protein [Chryseolinea lacunae]